MSDTVKVDLRHHPKNVLNVDASEAEVSFEENKSSEA